MKLCKRTFNKNSLNNSKQQSIINLIKKTFFLKSSAPVTGAFNNSELPEKNDLTESVAMSRRTYTKWFNPNNFDPRTPDYINSVKSTWEEDSNREEIGDGKFKYNNKHIIHKFTIQLLYFNI